MSLSASGAVQLPGLREGEQQEDAVTNPGAVVPQRVLQPGQIWRTPVTQPTRREAP